MSSRLSSERGAILIQVAIASLVLIAFSMFVVDYGVMWVSRGQAQNAADAGALAGAVALAFDDFENREDDGPAKQSAQQFALLNSVFGEAPDVKVNTDVIFYDDDPAKFPAECADDTCIRVDVYRNQARENALPMMFGQLVGLVEQGVRATAIARAAFGNATNCLKPWAIIDRWEEHWPKPVVPFNDSSTFDKYNGNGTINPAITDPDVYRPASVDYDEEGNVIWDTYSPGTGYTPFDSNQQYTADYGRQMALKAGSDWSNGWYQALALGGPGGSTYRNNISGCYPATFKIGDEVPVETGVMHGPTRQGVEALVAQDPGAYWDPSLNGGRGGVAGSAFESSPRIVAIPFVNPDLMAAATGPGGNGMVPIGNIGGFFVEGVSGNGNSQQVIGRLVTIPGLRSAEPDGAMFSMFMQSISLIR